MDLALALDAPTWGQRWARRVQLTVADGLIGQLRAAAETTCHDWEDRGLVVRAFPGNHPPLSNPWALLRVLTFGAATAVRRGFVDWEGLMSDSPYALLSLALQGPAVPAFVRSVRAHSRFENGPFQVHFARRAAV
ncbi:MAG: hypothetical protein K1X79_06230 [Oligoflexia bacterium]|nr:hypothetical protein [Oligoflexia bacterium]